MALQQDFENRRRERLRRQREKRRRMRMIRLGAAAVVLIVVIILIISGISRCARNNAANDSVSETAAVTQLPIESVTSAPVQTPLEESAIPAPEVGDNNLLDQMVASGEKGHVYLTFDDGPNDSVTPQILDILRKYNVKATFFMVGQNIEKTPYMCTRVIEEGHLAAPHSYSHNYGEVYSDDDTFREEVDRTYQLIVANTPGNAEPFKVFRFPGGGYDDDNYGSAKQDYKDSLAEMGFYYCDWNTMTGDAEGTGMTGSEMLDYFNENRPNLNNLVILMHDAADKQATVDMLPALIEQLLSEGYTFSRLDEIDYSGAPAAASDEPSQTPDNSGGDSDDNNDSVSPTEGGSSSSGGGGSSADASSSGSGSSSGRSSSSGSGSSSGRSSSSGNDSSSSGSSSGSSTSGGSSSSGDEGVTRTTTTTSGTTTTETVPEDENVLEPE